MILYSQTKIASELEHLKGWHFENNALEKHFKFDTFSNALGFIVQVGLAAEKQNHHPELFNVYTTVRLRLATHDANGVTKKDFDLAIAIDQMV